MLLASCVLSVALVLGGGGGAQAQAAYWRHCGDQNHPGAGWYNVRGHNHFDGWSCTNESVGEELAIADLERFRQGKFQRVKFENGA